MSINNRELYRELFKKTGISFSLGDDSGVISISRTSYNDVIFNDIDMDQIELLVPDGWKQRARRLTVSDQVIGTKVLERFLQMFPNLTEFRFFNCRYEAPALYKVFENRAIEELDLPLFANDAVCFDSLSTLGRLKSLHLINLNSATGFDKITSNLQDLTIHAPDLTMGQCLRFPELKSLDIFSGCIEPEVDFPKLAELPALKRLKMPVHGDTFKYISDLPKLEVFTFKQVPRCKEPDIAYSKTNIQYSDGDFTDFPTLDSLKFLDLSYTDISLQSLEQIISKVVNVKELSVGSKIIENDDLLCIAKLRQLKRCNFHGTKVKGSTMKKLAAELPNCEFVL